MAKGESPRSKSSPHSPADRPASVPAAPDALKIVLISPRNPLNIGAAARAMSNFGFSEMRLVNPYEVAFKEARSAVKAHRILEDVNRIKGEVEKIIEMLRVMEEYMKERIK